MRIQRIDDAFEVCELHLSSGDVESEVKDLLTRALLILICAEFERKIKELVKEKCQSIADDQVRQFAQNSTERMFRGLKIGDLAGLLAHFSREYKLQFDNNPDETAKNMYSSILTNRNAIAHGGESVATFQDVKRYYKKAHFVLDWFERALKADAADFEVREENMHDGVGHR